MAEDFTTRAVAQAERMISDGEFSLALDRLKTAAGNVPGGQSDAPALFARIRDLADAVTRDDPAFAPQAQEVKDVVERRRAFIAGWRGESEARPLLESPVFPGALSRRVEPWFYGVAETVANVALVASVLNAIGGIVVGVAASSYMSFDGETRHHAGIVILGIVGGLLGAALWLGFAAALSLLVDNGRMLRASRGNLNSG